MTTAVATLMTTVRNSSAEATAGRSAALSVKKRGSASSSNKTNSSDNNKNKKPRRPLNAYNIFFSYMRARFLQLSDATDDSASSQQLLPVPSNLTTSDIHFVLDSGTCLIGSQGRRRHRKSHGKISFKELTQIVSSGLSALSKDSKRAFYDVSDQRAKQFTLEEEAAAYKCSTRRDRDCKRKEATMGTDAVTVDGAKHGSRRKKACRNNDGAPVIVNGSSCTNTTTSQAAAANNETFYGRCMSRKSSSVPALAASTSVVLSNQERQHKTLNMVEEEDKSWLENISSPHDDVDVDIIGALCRMHDADK